MIKNYFSEEHENDTWIEYDRYFSDIQVDIDHAKQIKQELINKILFVIDLCNIKELEDLSELILGAADKLEALRHCGR